MAYTEQLCFDLNTGGKMPAVGYGTWQSSGADFEKALNVALETGYRHIDTAYIYRNEHIIGKVLDEWISAGKLKREDLFIVTKLPFNALRASSVEKYLTESLNALKLDYVDMYLIHGPFGFQEEDEVYPRKSDGDCLIDVTTDHVSLWKAMEEQVDAGRTKAIGVSNFSEKQIQRILSNSRIPPANHQIELHLLMQQKPMVEFCKQNGILVTSYSSLGSPGTWEKTGKSVPNLLEHEVVVQIAAKHDKTPAQVALRFLVQNEIVVIPKSVTEKRIAENFEILDFNLDDDDMEQLSDLDQGEDGRLLKFHEFFPGIEKHPEYYLPV